MVLEGRVWRGRLELIFSVQFNAQGATNWTTLCNSDLTSTTGYASASCYYALGSQPGQVSASSAANLFTVFYVYQIVPSCSSNCYDFDDYYGYSFLGVDGQQHPNGTIFSAPGYATAIVQSLALLAYSSQTRLALGSCTDDRLVMIYQYPNVSFGVTIDASMQGGKQPWIPNCAWFTKGAQSTYYTFQQLGNIGKQPYSWALVKRPLSGSRNDSYGLDPWTLLLWQAGWGGTGYQGAQAITSTFCPPAYDSLYGIVPGGRHRFGDAVDIQNYSQSQPEHDAKACYAGKAAAHLPAQHGGGVPQGYCPNDPVGPDAGADWIEPTMPNMGCAYACIHADWRNHAYDLYSQYDNP